MIIYRLLGRMSVWTNCGMLPVDPVSLSALHTLRKIAAKVRKQAENDSKSYILIIQKLTIKTITKDVLIEAFNCEHPDALIRTTEEIDRWEFTADNT